VAELLTKHGLTLRLSKVIDHPELLDFVCRVLPDERDQDVVPTVVVTGRRPF
jgi:hypothetical protein